MEVNNGQMMPVTEEIPVSPEVQRLEKKLAEAEQAASLSRAKVGSLGWKIFQTIFSIVMIGAGVSGDYELAILPGSGSGLLIAAGAVWFIFDIYQLVAHRSKAEAAESAEARCSAVMVEIERAKSGNIGNKDVWLCKKCNGVTPSSQMTCRDCGAYK